MAALPEAINQNTHRKREQADQIELKEDKLIEDKVRRRRYERAPSASALVTLTPTKVRLLRFLAECRFLSLPQLARLCCPSERAEPVRKERPAAHA